MLEIWQLQQFYIGVFRVTQKALQLSFFFFLFLIPNKKTGKRFLIPSVFLADMCDNDRESFIGHTGKLLCLHLEIWCVEAWYEMW